MDIVSAIFTPEVTSLIAQAVIALIGTLLTVLVGGAIRLLKARTTSEQYSYLQSVATVAVQAAEQMHLAGYIMDKKAVAEGIVLRELASRGVKVDQTVIDTAIEAAVMDVFNSVKVTDPQPEASVTADVTTPPFYGSFSAPQA